MIDVLLVSLGSTGGLRAADEELLGSLRRAGAHAELVRAQPPRPQRTLMLTDLAWALAARRAARRALACAPAHAVIYSTSTAAMLWPVPGAIRFDALAFANRPARHGLWQRPLERRRLRQARLLLPQDPGALAEAPPTHHGVRADDERVLVLPVPVEPSGASGAHGGPPADTDGFVGQRRDIDVITYAANPSKKGLDRLLAAWELAHRPGERLHVAGVDARSLASLGYRLPSEVVQPLGTLPPAQFRGLLRRARVYACAARREDYGIAQLEALADGCVLVTVASPGPYAALPLARELDPRLVGEDLAAALRIALDDPRPGYGERALKCLEPFRRSTVDRLVAEELLPRLLAT